MSASSTLAALAVVAAGAAVVLAARGLGVLYANHLLRRALRDQAMRRQGSYGEEE